MNGDQQEDRKLLQVLAATVESIRDRMATKEDLLSLRDQMDRDLDSLREQMATKEDLADLRDQMATKEEIASLEGRMTLLAGRMATKEDVTAIRGDIERVHLRLDGVDRTVTTRMDQVDNQISRLRSVVYLLGKDQPEILRLLGDRGL